MCSVKGEELRLTVIRSVVRSLYSDIPVPESLFLCYIITEETHKTLIRKPL